MSENPQTTMIDLAFDLEGAELPRHHRAALARAIQAQLPMWAQLEGASIHRLNTCTTTGPMTLLSRRTRLVLRVPRESAQAVAGGLDGCELRVAGASLRLSRPQPRELLPWGTIYAHAVVAEGEDGAGIDDEALFIERVHAQLDTLGVKARVICGRRQAIDADGLQGYSLMLDQLGAADALRLMECGLGRHRHLGCGVFVPHKSAAAVGSPP